MYLNTVYREVLVFAPVLFWPCFLSLFKHDCVWAISRIGAKPFANEKGQK